MPVYFVRSATPEAEIDLDSARLLVRENHARWINRCKAIRLLRERFDLRGLSCSFRPDVALKTSPEVQAAVMSYLSRDLSQ